ncbi:unnamed protein product [Camellia sinensis]
MILSLSEVSVELHNTTMSFVFRGTRADIETGLPGIIPERRAVRVHAARPVNTNSLAFLVTVLLLFMILNSHQMSPNFLLWLVFGVFFMATSLRMYATCQQLQAQAQSHALAASGLLGHTELRLHMPPSIALATRGRLQGLRLQLALIDREFDDLDYETLRALDSDNVPTVPSMSEEEINVLPVHKYKVAGSHSGISSMQVASSSASAEKKQDIANAAVGSTKAAEDELTCSVCLEQVNVGELVRSLPCLHQVGNISGRLWVWNLCYWYNVATMCPILQFQAIWAGSSCGWHNVVTMFLFCSSMPSALIRGCASRELVLSVNLKLGQDCTTMDKAVLMLPIWSNRLTETFVAAYKITYTAIYP